MQFFMKSKLIPIALLCFLFCANKVTAQITLDTSYAMPSRSAVLYMVNLEVSGPKYVLKCDDSGNRFLKFYNLNHSLWKTINCNPFKTSLITAGGTPRTQFNFGAFFISESLFDCDSNIEFLYTSSAGFYDQSFVRVYNELGTTLLSCDSCLSYLNSTTGAFNTQNRTIYNTPGGTKMILTKCTNTSGTYGGYTANGVVYNLPCVLTTGIGGLNKKVEGDMTVVPNPHYYESTINYSLPDNVSQAEIIISNMEGREMKRYQVDKTFNSLLIGHDDLPSGTYLYSLVSGGTVLSATKAIKLN
jgi:hypothetical protein